MSGFRILDMWLSIAAAALMIAVNIHRWWAMDVPDRLVRVGFITLFIAAAYGFAAAVHPSTAEILFRYLLFSSALLQLVIALTWTLVRQIRRRHDHEENQ